MTGAAILSPIFSLPAEEHEPSLMRSPCPLGHRGVRPASWVDAAARAFAFMACRSRLIEAAGPCAWPPPRKAHALNGRGPGAAGLATGPARTRQQGDRRLAPRDGAPWKQKWTVMRALGHKPGGSGSDHHSGPRHRFSDQQVSPTGRSDAAPQPANLPVHLLTSAGGSGGVLYRGSMKLKPIPQLDDPEAMAALGRERAMYSLRADVLARLRDTCTHCQTADWPRLAELSDDVMLCADRLRWLAGNAT